MSLRKMTLAERVFAMAFAAALLFAGLSASAQSGSTNQEKPFVSGGKIEIQLESGDYAIKPASDDRIHITWSGPRVERVKVTINTNGNHADLRVANTPDNNFHATIEVPAASDLTVRLTAGNLEIGPISGNKDISLRAGNLDVKISDPNDYARVEASVTAGDLNTPAFGGSTGGLFRSFKWTGKGKYTLTAHLMAGDLNLRK